ncbi:14313_t:CDS:2, partial [Funneliformis geosporum]
SYHFIPGVKETLKKDETPSKSSIPCKIGSKMTLEEYNNFFMCKESSWYKYQRKNYFKAANEGVFINSPICVTGDGFCFNPNVNEGLIAPDTTVTPHLNYGNPHARIICEVANCQNIGQLIENDKIALLYQQEVPEYQIWDFGTHQTGKQGCIAPNIPAYQINIPVNQVFWDPPTIPAAAGYVPVVPPAVTLANFTIDLYIIQ